jgi:DnaJ-class molecular chaperone
MRILKTLPSLLVHNQNIRYFSTSTASAKNTKKTYYQLLEVPSNATMANIKNNYLRLAKIYHPDVYKGKDKDRFQRIQEAYKVLIDKVKRVRYDEEIGISVNTDRGAQDEFTQKNDGSSEKETGKPKNPMSYEST